MVTKILFIGIGGYGAGYIREWLAHPERTDVEVVGVVDPYAASSAVYGEVVARGVPVFDTLEAFDLKGSADLAVISSPIPHHEAQSVHCMRRGMDVLLEKPIAATVEAAERMLAVRDGTGRMLAIGFQWCYAPGMLALKRDVEAGLYGKPIAMKALVFFPRDFAYYSRGSGWAGKRKAVDGTPINDSVASNATAHYLENMLWLAGEGFDGAAIETMEVETLRAYPIETYDTVTLRGTLAGGCGLFYTASHATGRDFAQSPMFEYVFEKGTVTLGGPGIKEADPVARFLDGTEKRYPDGAPYAQTMRKLWTAVDVMRGAADLPCPAEAAMKHMLAIAMVDQVSPVATAFPPEEVRDEGGQLIASGLYGDLFRCYRERKLYSEL